MKKKQREAMIAMGIKIAAQEHLLKMHGEAHMAQDLLPQFTELVKKVEKLELGRKDWTDAAYLAMRGRVEKLEGTLNFKLNDGPIYNHGLRLNALEKHILQVNASENIARICERLNDHDESIEALSETVDQLSTAKSLDGKIDFVANQVKMLEKTVYNSPFSKIVMEEYAEKIKTLEESNRVFLKNIPDIEILKVQMHNLIPVHNNMMTEVLGQKAFLEKVQKILDRERDARIKESPGYKKEIAAMKKEASVMDTQHVDMMVKKGRPRKP